MKRVSFLIDGFNLYHSVKDLYDITGIKAKWLNLSSLCQSYVYLFGKDAVMKDIFYFSAYPNHLKTSRPDTIARHKDFVACLEDLGVKVQLGRFKEKKVYCSNCNKYIIKHEEKETDVAIAIKIIELFHTDSCDLQVIVSGDTDLAPAIRTSIKLFPLKQICFAFPFNRKMKELSNLSTLPSFSISSSNYQKHLLPDPYTLKSGRIINKPSKW
jgi:uncharacterized LabA/DUF88 family protein